MTKTRRPLARPAAIVLVAALLFAAPTGAFAAEADEPPSGAATVTTAPAPGDDPGSETSEPEEPREPAPAPTEGETVEEPSSPDGPGTEPDEVTAATPSDPPAEPQTEPAAQGQKLQNAVAPASSSTLAPGTYTITANLYVAGSDAPIGVNAYLTDRGFPPISPQKQNATLVVGSDGTLRLTVALAQETFTLQRIGDTENATIVSAERGGSISGAPAGALYTDRITELTVLLGDANGRYTFTDVIEYPSILNTEKTWPIHLGVDFATAVRQVVGDFHRTYTDAGTGVSVTVEAGEGSPSIPRLSSATLSVAPITAGATFDAAKRALDRSFTTDPEFTLHDIRLTAEGTEIVLDDNAIASVSLPTDVENAAVYRVEGSAATAAAATAADGRIITETRTFGTFAVVDADTATAWAGTKTLTGAIAGASLTYSTTGLLEQMLLGADFATMESYGIYNAYFTRSTRALDENGALDAIRKLDVHERAEIEGLYALGFDVNMEKFPANQKHSPFSWLGADYQTSLTATVPVGGEGRSVYLVSGTVGKGLTSAEPLDATASGEIASFDLASKDASLDPGRQQALSAMWNAASGWDGQFDSDAPDAHGWTDATPIAYVVVVREAPQEIDRPTAATGLVYDGSAQSGVVAGEGYTISAGASGTDAGEYVALAVPQPGFAWPDGSTTPAAIAWSIGKAELTAQFRSETVPMDGTPQLAVDITGFVAGETAADAKGFTAPVVDAPDELVAGQELRLTPRGGSAANYSFVYRQGTLTVTAATAPSLQPGTYRITANLFVPAAENDILGLTAYLTNPKNPLVGEKDPDYGIPTAPVADNATLVVAKDGTRTVLVDLPNPAFTLMSFGSSGQTTVLGVERDRGVYGANKSGRITRAAIRLAPGATSAVFADSHVYAAPLRLDKTWDIHLSVGLTGAVRISDDTTANVPGGTDGGTVPNPGTGTPGTGTVPAQKPTNRQLRPGTYTVTANIWLSRADTGLPLNPHLTSAAFPPMDPVRDNARLVVDANGRAVVTVPIAIQSRIMSVRSVTGAGVSTTGGGTVDAVVIDLGVLTDRDTQITRPLSAAVTIGDLAMSIGGPIFGGTAEHTWPATFQLNLSGVPTSGGGVLPAWAASALQEPDVATDLEASKAALDAAREANEQSKAAAAGETQPAEASAAMSPALFWTTVALLAALAAGALILVRRARARTRSAAEDLPPTHTLLDQETS